MAGICCDTWPPLGLTHDTIFSLRSRSGMACLAQGKSRCSQGSPANTTSMFSIGMGFI